MLVFGHVGLTLGAAAAVDCMYTTVRKTIERPNAPGLTRPPFLAILPKRVDLRILLAGSLLPDAIDKPLGIYILGNTIGNGRIFSHSLLFLFLCIIIGALVFWRWRRTWGLVLAFGTFTHLVFDSMWTSTQALYWPFTGATFPKDNTSHWLEDVAHNLVTKSKFYVPEIAGIIILLAFLVIVLKRKSLGALIRTGKVL